MTDKEKDVKPAPRESLLTKDLVGFQTNYESGETVSKTGLTKSGKSQNGKAIQPSWARG